jgi:hypothetical protein
MERLGAEAASRRLWASRRTTLTPPSCPQTTTGARCVTVVLLFLRAPAKKILTIFFVTPSALGDLCISAAEAHTAAQRLLTDDPSLAHLGPLLAPSAFVDDGYIGLGVPIGTDAFVQHFVKKKCQEIMDDVDKLDNIQDGFIHYQLVRFCQATRLQYLNGQIDLANQNVLQQQHVDWKISNALLKKGTRDAYKTWNQQDRAWVDMRLHESHDEGGFGVSNNTITRHAASYTTNARFVAFLGTFARPAQQIWLPGNDLQDPSS